MNIGQVDRVMAATRLAIAGAPVETIAAEAGVSRGVAKSLIASDSEATTPTRGVGLRLLSRTITIPKTVESRLRAMGREAGYGDDDADTMALDLIDTAAEDPRRELYRITADWARTRGLVSAWDGREWTPTPWPTPEPAPASEPEVSP